MFWEKPVLSFGAHRGRLPLLVVCSLPIFGRFLCRKNPLGKKNFWVTGRSRLLWHVLALLASCSLPVFGRLLLLPSVGVRKNSPWEKNLYLVRKTLGVFGKNLFTVACEVDGRVCLRFGVCGAGGRFYVLFQDRFVFGRPFGAFRGWWPSVRLRSAANLGKNPLGEKPLLSLGKTRGLLGKPVSGKI